MMHQVINAYRSAAGGGGSGDPNFANVVLLMGFEGANGSTSFVDESPVARTMTAAGNAQITTSQFKFGSSCATFDGSGDYITAPDSADWNFGTGPFQFELFARMLTKANSQAFFGQWADDGFTGNSSWYFWIQGGLLTFRISRSVVVDLSSAWTPTLGQWYHLAVSRDVTGKTRLFIDGVMVASSTEQNITTLDSTNVFSIGRIGTGATFSSFDYNGQMDEIRVVKGDATYTSDSGFTVPAAAFPRS